MSRRNWAIVPIKSFATAKSRLSARLTAQQREQLSEVMLFDVLSALSKTNGLSGVLVVTNETGAMTMSRKFGFSVMNETDHFGPTHAIGDAIRTLVQDGCTGILALMGDLPLITEADISQILTAHSSDRAVTLVPSHNNLGTNAAFCAPPEIIPLTFNGRGLADHLRLGQLAGAETHILDLPRVALDLDQPEDISTLIAMPSSCKTRSFLLEIAQSGALAQSIQQKKTG